MTPPVVVAELPQQHDVVIATAKHPITAVTSIDEKALAGLEIHDKLNEDIKDNINHETNGHPNNKSSDESDDKSTNKYRNKYHGRGGNYLLHPRAITTDFDLLRFHAAAYTQLSHSSPSVSAPCFSPHPDPQTTTTAIRPLISSPYNKTGHYLDLADEGLSRESHSFAMALTVLKPTVSNYATAPYTEALNFETVLDVLRTLISHESPGEEGEEYEWKETSFYVVVFRSQLKPDVDQGYLYQLDEESHREACESGGLLKYWFGKAGLERRNLATCFWHSREDAQEGGKGPWHKKARAAGTELYESIVFTTHRFTVLDGATGFKFEDWE